MYYASIRIGVAVALGALRPAAHMGGGGCWWRRRRRCRLCILRECILYIYYVCMYVRRQRLYVVCFVCETRTKLQITCHQLDESCCYMVCWQKERRTLNQRDKGANIIAYIYIYIQYIYTTTYIYLYIYLYIYEHHSISWQRHSWKKWLRVCVEKEKKWYYKFCESLCGGACGNLKPNPIYVMRRRRRRRRKYLSLQASACVYKIHNIYFASIMFGYICTNRIRERERAFVLFATLPTRARAYLCTCGVLHMLVFVYMYIQVVLYTNCRYVYIKESSSILYS